MLKHKSLHLRYARTRTGNRLVAASPSDPIARVNTLSKVARTNWFALLAYLAFTGVTLLSVQDVDFFMNSRRTQLPIVGVEVPTRLFFLLAPILGMLLYAYLHLYLLKLWEAVATATPWSEDDDPTISDKMDPWLVNDFALWLRGGGTSRRRSMYWVSHVVTAFLVFLFGPIVIGWFWWRVQPSQDLLFSLIATSVLVITVMICLTSAYVAVTRLRFNRAFSSWRWHLTSMVVALLLAVGLTFVTLSRVGNVAPFFTQFLPHSMHWMIRFDAIPAASADLSDERLVTDGLALLDYDIHARRFRYDWCGRQGLGPEECGGRLPFETLGQPVHIYAARDRWCADDRFSEGQCDGFFANLETRFEEAWRFERAAATTARGMWRVPGVPLRNANMSGATITGAILNGADLSGAIVNQTELEGASLTGARLDSAVLMDSAMQGANLRSVRAEGVHLVRNNLQGATLDDAMFAKGALIGNVYTAASVRNVDISGALIVGGRTWSEDEDPYNLIDNHDISERFRSDPNIRNSNFPVREVTQEATTGAAFRFVSIARLGDYTVDRYWYSRRGLDFTLAFADGTAEFLLPDSYREWEPHEIFKLSPCYQPEGVLDDFQFFGMWRGWMEFLGQSWPPNSQMADWMLVDEEKKLRLAEVPVIEPPYGEIAVCLRGRGLSDDANIAALITRLDAADD